ncbi:hypothetical protein HF086_008945 [Spodoptera exigua]|uniref:G-protein coupled receptors family 1 profile domain-containing protein n=1 Tax=Spodoptera exigua TaxID=7107 RepID=A0A922MS11_SPOEX|nr:hypothetical protein HF086_008945 [Spodoptera exigua]
MACDYNKTNVRMVYTSSEELASVGLYKCYPETLLTITFACHVVFMLIGIPGNLTTIIALAFCRKVRNATAIFIINLHISDLIFGSMILPMTAVTFWKKQWTHGWIMCRVYAYCKIYKRRNITIILILIWILSSTLFLPSFFGVWGRFDLEPNLGFCTTLDDENGKSPKKFFASIAFVAPTLIIAMCYARILWVVRKTKRILQGQGPKSMGPTHLPLTRTQSDTSTDGGTLISIDPASLTNSRTSDDLTPPSSATATPRGHKTFDNYFKATLRLTRKEKSPKSPTSRDKRLFAMIVAIIVSYTLTHLPLMVTRLLYKEYNSDPYANELAHLFGCLRTCMNPIIYVLISNEYRYAYRSLLENIMNKFRRQ